MRGTLCGCNQESWAGLYKRCSNKENLFGFRCDLGKINFLQSQNCLAWKRSLNPTVVQHFQVYLSRKPHEQGLLIPPAQQCLSRSCCQQVNYSQQWEFQG